VTDFIVLLAVIVTLINRLYFVHQRELYPDVFLFLPFCWVSLSLPIIPIKSIFDNLKIIETRNYEF
jgi:hypothetical protein